MDIGFAMKIKLITIFKDLTFLLFALLVLSNLLSVWLCYPICWFARYEWLVKYGMILWACNAAYILVKKGNSVFLVTAIIGTIVAAAYPFFP